MIWEFLVTVVLLLLVATPRVQDLTVRLPRNRTDVQLVLSHFCPISATVVVRGELGGASFVSSTSAGFSLSRLSLVSSPPSILFIRPSTAQYTLFHALSLHLHFLQITGSVRALGS